MDTEQKLKLLMAAAKYAVNRLDAARQQPQVSGDLAITLASIMTREEYEQWDRERGEI